MSNSFARFTISLSCAISLVAATLTGCDTYEPAPTELGETADLEYRATPAETIAAVAEDPELLQLVDLGVEQMRDHLLAQAQMTDGDIQAQLATINHPAYFELVAPEEFYEGVGVTSSVVDQQRALVQSISDRHGLLELTASQRAQVFAQALESEGNRSYIEGKIEYELHDIEGDVDTEIDDCEAACVVAYTAAATAAIIAYVSALAAAVALGPGGPIAAAIATASYVSALATAQAANDQCFAECNGEIISNEECDSDSDCANDEFCWKGVAGIGANECRPLKDEGKTCSRHGQCESGCCKLHVWTNPFSKTCRPSNKC